MKFRPMLASAIEDTSKIKFPVFISPKLDGVRATVQGGKLLSRNLKPIPNQNVQQKFALLPDGLDGELIVGNPTDKEVFSNTTSVVMSRNKPADNVYFYVFDIFSKKPFHERMSTIVDWHHVFGDKSVGVVNQITVNNEKELLTFEEAALWEGYEGLMVRSIDGPYKQDGGVEERSTLREGYLLKLKRFKDGEARITGFEEEQKNTNERTTNNLGKTERSSAKSGLVGKGRLGKFEVVGVGGTFDGVAFSVGGGLSGKQRQEFWDTRQKLVGRILKFKYFPVGSVDKPRFPGFIGFRDKRDM